jgi:uncharacterized protein (DUF1330 family)
MLAARADRDVKRTTTGEVGMAKAYWIGCIRKVLDQAKFEAYQKLARPALEAGGGRYIARGTPARVYDAGVMERTVIIEFPSVAAAIAAHDSDGYKKAVEALDGGVEREIRIVEAVD